MNSIADVIETLAATLDYDNTIEKDITMTGGDTDIREALSKI